MKILRTFDLGPGRHESGMEGIDPRRQLEAIGCAGKEYLYGRHWSIRHDIALKAESASVSH